MFDINPKWPIVVWNAFKEDGVNMTIKLGELITKNVLARTNYKFNKNENLNENEVHTGDIFKEENETGNFKYLINVRPQCDITRNSNPELYCLEGKIIDETKINKEDIEDPYSFKQGHFYEKINNVFVIGIDEGKIIEFKFRNIKIKKYNSIKSIRIGRLLPPYITRIQQKYTLYLQREGVPRIPKEAIFDDN